MTASTISIRLATAMWLAIFGVAVAPAVGAERPERAARVLSDADALILRSVFKAANKGEWKAVRDRQARLKDPLARKLVIWRRLTGRGVTPAFDEVEVFLTENPGWPRRARLLHRAEQALPADWSHERVIAWFGGREPESALGAARLGAAEMAKGAADKGAGRTRAAWIDGDFSSRQARAFLKTYRKVLRPADHQRRLDRLLWDGRHSAARRMFSLVSPAWRKLAQARIALRRSAGNVDSLIDRVPAPLQAHPGLVYERLLWRRRKNLDSAIELAKSVTTPQPYAELWWEERAVLARRALRAGDVTDAYQIAMQNGLEPEGAAHAEAEWLAGWIALRFLNDAETALGHFTQMHGAVNYQVSIARGAYWAGRAVDAKPNKTKDDAKAAADWYGKAAAHPLTYYGQLAYARLHPGRSLKLPGFVTLPDEPMAEFDDHELVRVIRMLADIAAHDQVRAFVNSLMALSEKPQWWARTAQLARLSGRPDLSIWIAKKADRNGTALPREAFPVLALPELPTTATSERPEVPLALAVIRQESAFRVTALSHAGAQGLMQLMPATAKRVASGLKLRYSKLRLVTSPKYNLTLGQSYLGDLIKEFSGSYVLALVGYNAGPHRARRWIKQHGDPRDADVDAIDWVEMIPFNETRNYVQRVLENLQVYRLGLAKTEVALGLETDLHFSAN